MLDTIVGVSIGECTYAEIVEKLEKISHNNKAWSTKMSDIGRNTFPVQATNNSTTNEIREEIKQMRNELGLVFEHVGGGTKKVNVMNYLEKPPPLDDEY